MPTRTRVTYTLADVGCYVDGSRGIYAIDRIVEIAEANGMAEPEPCECEGHGVVWQRASSPWAGCEYVGEREDDCDDYMNEHHGVDGASWGRSEAGDWGLWECEE